MTRFSELNIKHNISSFTGDKIKIGKLLNVEIQVLQYKVENSKVKEGTELLTLQIKKKEEVHVVFTGSKVLIDQINQVPKDKFPFTTTITNPNEYYQFT